MAIYKYPPEVHEFVKQWCPKLRDKELAAACNKELGTAFTASTMRSFRGNHGYRKGRKTCTDNEAYWKYQTRYPQGMYEFIRDNSWGKSSQEMADMVNDRFGTKWTMTGMKQFRKRYGISSGLTGRFRKGQASANKGKKLDDIIKDPDRAADVRQRMAATQFKKGERPANERPVGSIVVSSEGYCLRKKQMEGSLWERWEFLHRAVWEEHYGPIPEGMVVSFRDSNRLNCDISNLMLITKGENASLTRCGYRFEDPDLTDAGLSLIRLKNTAKEAKKHKRKILAEENDNDEQRD